MKAKDAVSMMLLKPDVLVFNLFVLLRIVKNEIKSLYDISINSLSHMHRYPRGLE